MIYSAAGWIYESVLCSVAGRKFINRGFLNGPYCPVYGCGALLDIIILGNIENPLLLFIFGVVLDCGLEYVTSWLMEKLFNARWWDYSDRKFNLNGRVCLLGAFIFGLLSVILIKFIHPFVSFLTDNVSGNTYNIISAALFLLFVSDCIVTVTGITGFNGKLHEVSEVLKKLKDEALQNAEERKNAVTDKLKETELYTAMSSAYEEFRKKINHQERRILKAFPKLKSIHYNEALSGFRAFVQKIKNNRK